MVKQHFHSKIMAAFITKLTLLAAYLLALRPWHLKWGASEDEVSQPLPGDDLIPEPQTESTRAITINAPATTVWPWLVQIGQGRGGFYSYDWLENLFGLNIHSANRIIPQWQALNIDDIVRLTPEGAEMSVATIEPNRALVLRAIDPSTKRPVDRDKPTYWDFTWAFVLHELDERSTRLVVRARGDYKPASLTVLGFLLEPIQFVMERKMLLGIKQRAEVLARLHREL